MSSVRLLWWHDPVTTAGTCHQYVQFTGPLHSLFPNTHGTSLSFFSTFVSVCYKYMLTNELLTQRGLPFSSPWEAWKHDKWWKIGWKTMKIRGFFKSFKFVVFLGCFTATWGSLETSLGCPEASWRRLGGLRAVLEASWRVLEASWRCLGGILGRLGGILDVSWGKCRKNAKGSLFFGRVLKANMEAKIIKIHIKHATCFSWRF